jgi:hypothetical protein
MPRKAINRNSPDKWKQDIIQSVDLYNSWFMEFAPRAFREARLGTTERVEQAMKATENLQNISCEVLMKNPDILQILRMSTCPPIARDRLIGLAEASGTLIKSMEDAENPRIPPRMNKEILNRDLERICGIIRKMCDLDVFVWLNRKESATKAEIVRAATIVADRLCGAVSNPIIRNVQEKRQLAAIGDWLNIRGYRRVEGIKFSDMKAGTYSFRTNLPVSVFRNGKTAQVNIPVDVAVMPIKAKNGELPILIEAKSAGDKTNVNKRQKEEAHKMAQLKSTYGKDVCYGLFLCGYFDSGYLGCEAAEGIDWVWEHRIDDLALCGL